MPNKFEGFVVGHAGKDAEQTATAKGKPAVKFSLAVTTGKEPDKKTTWFNFTAYGKAAVENAKHIKKGQTAMADIKDIRGYKDSIQCTTFDVYLIDWKKADYQGTTQTPNPGQLTDDNDLPF